MQVSGELDFGCEGIQAQSMKREQDYFSKLQVGDCSRFSILSHSPTLFLLPFLFGFHQTFTYTLFCPHLNDWYFWNNSEPLCMAPHLKSQD